MYTWYSAPIQCFVCINYYVESMWMWNSRSLFYLQIIDAGELALMAGVVDSHVHVNEPGRTSWEGYVSATQAAAVGGITTIIDMPLYVLN